MACARGMDILSEKPIADTPEACAAIARAVKAAGVRMMVTQNYRYTRRILTLKQALAELGAVNYAVARYASDYRLLSATGLGSSLSACVHLPLCGAGRVRELRR